MELSPLPQPSCTRPLLSMQRCSAERHDSSGFSTLSAFLPACSELPQTRTGSNSPLKHNNQRGNGNRTEKGPEAKLKPTMKKGWFCQDTRPVATAEGLFSPHQLLGSIAGFSWPSAPGASAGKAVPQGNSPRARASPSTGMGQRERPHHPIPASCGDLTPPPLGSVGLETNSRSDAVSATQRGCRGYPKAAFSTPAAQGEGKLADRSQRHLVTRTQ